MMLLSPMNYITLATSLPSEGANMFGGRDLTKNWIGFFVIPVVFFAIAYARFVRGTCMIRYSPFLLLCMMLMTSITTTVTKLETTPGEQINLDVRVKREL